MQRALRVLSHARLFRKYIYSTRVTIASCAYVYYRAEFFPMWPLSREEVALGMPGMTHDKITFNYDRTESMSFDKAPSFAMPTTRLCVQQEGDLRVGNVGDDTRSEITFNYNYTKVNRLYEAPSFAMPATTLRPTKKRCVRSPCRGSNDEIASSNRSVTLALIIIWITDDEILSLPLFALHSSIKLRAK